MEISQNVVPSQNIWTLLKYFKTKLGQNKTLSLQFQNFLLSISSSFVGRISAKSYWHCVFGNLNSKQFIDQKTLNGQHHRAVLLTTHTMAGIDEFCPKICCIFSFYACFDLEIKVILWLKLTNMQDQTFHKSKNKNLDAHFLLKWFFGNFNFKTFLLRKSSLLFDEVAKLGKAIQDA